MSAPHDLNEALATAMAAATIDRVHQLSARLLKQLDAENPNVAGAVLASMVAAWILQYDAAERAPAEARWLELMRSVVANPEGDG